MAQWIEPQPVQVPEDLRQAVAAFGAPLSALVAEMLVRRGISTPDIARAFLDPAAYLPASPEELPDLLLAVQRLEWAISRGEPIAVWGDFDVDGQTATALYLQALRDLGARVTFRIPTRRESHGLHLVGVQRLIDDGVQLIVTADTGVAAHKATALATGRGVDVLITDHHDLPPNWADLQALALVNPKRLPADHPLCELPGVGVSYQVVRALYDRAGRSSEHLLDLVALGIVADVATLHADVRYLLQRGLDVLRHTERLGLQVMMDLASLAPASVTEQDIAYTLAPRLNALSRVGQDMGTDAGVELLTTDDRTRARTIATALESLNARRKWLVRQTTEAALAQIERDRALGEGPAIVVADANWEPGVVGIVAGRLAERFHRPAIVLSAPPGEIARGSARSVAGVDIHAAIAAQQDMLYRCGGHPMAAGLSLESERIAEFRHALWRTLEQVGAAPAERWIQVDAYLSFDQISLELAAAVDLLSPFGPGNEQPVFATKGLELESSAVIGRTREHRRAHVRDAQGRRQTVFWWQSADQALPEGPFDLAYAVGIHTFRGQQSVQLTWEAARSVAPPAVEVIPRHAPCVRDCRDLAMPEPVLRALLADRLGQAIAWGEGVSVAGVTLCNRAALHEAETLIVWTAPPGPAEWVAALEVVSPGQVVLFGVDPGLDAPRAFLQRLGGLVKHALQKYAGQVDLSSLAAAMAHGEWTVRLGLEWMAQRGQVEVVFAKRGRISLSKGQGDVGSRLDVVEGQLQAQLEETAAYRAYFRHADAQRLVRWD
jgi:single-stranded-DNA-specific exonuclease